MKFSAVRELAMSLPEVSEQPHHHFGSFRVRGRIFVTTPPGESFIHVFLPEQQRELGLAMYPEFVEKLLWGGKVVGVKVSLEQAQASAVKAMVRQAWHAKAPKSLRELDPRPNRSPRLNVGRGAKDTGTPER